MPTTQVLKAAVGEDQSEDAANSFQAQLPCGMAEWVRDRPLLELFAGCPSQ